MTILSFFLSLLHLKEIHIYRPNKLGSRLDSNSYSKSTLTADNRSSNHVKSLAQLRQVSAHCSKTLILHLSVKSLNRHLIFMIDIWNCLTDTCQADSRTLSGSRSSGVSCWFVSHMSTSNSDT